MFRNFLRLFLVLVVVGFATQVQATTLLANWALNESSGATTAADYGPSGYTLSQHYSGVTAPAAGQTPPSISGGAPFSTAWYFYGSTSSSYGSLQSSNNVTTLTGNTAVTFSAWVWVDPNTTAHNGEQILRCNSDSGGATRVFALECRNTKDGGTWNGWNMCMNNGDSASGGTKTLVPYGSVSGWQLGVGSWDLNNSPTAGLLKDYPNGVYRTATAAATAAKNYASYTNPVFAINGSANVNNTGVMGYIEDATVWQGQLSNAKIAALYKAPVYFGGLVSGNANAYGGYDMNRLFTVYDTTTGTPTVGGKTWQYDAAITVGAHVNGDTWYDGTSYHILLDAAGGKGLSTIVPEPSTLALLAAGLLGLLCYAWRKRK